MKAALLSRDLLVVSKFQAAAERQGVEAAIAGTPSELVALGAVGDVVVVILDLASPGCVPADLVSGLRALAHPPRSVLAFGPHVQAERLHSARGAGCDEVLTRGQFHAQMDAILARCKTA